MLFVQVANFPYLGRKMYSVTTMRDSTFESRAYGKRVNKIISIEGRVQFDLLQVSEQYRYGERHSAGGKMSKWYM